MSGGKGDAPHSEDSFVIVSPFSAAQAMCRLRKEETAFYAEMRGFIHMSTREFISQLDSALRGEVSEAVIQENINYYEGYIREQVAAGRDEREVLEMLGDPRLIARTIIDTNGGDGSYQTNRSRSSSYSQSSQQYETHTAPTGSSGFHIHRVDGTKWYVKALLVAVPILFICLIVSIVMGILGLIVRFAVPIIIILVVIYLVKKILK